jgi:hypothetical protein
MTCLATDRDLTHVERIIFLSFRGLNPLHAQLQRRRSDQFLGCRPSRTCIYGRPSSTLLLLLTMVMQPATRRDSIR